MPIPKEVLAYLPANAGEYLGYSNFWKVWVFRVKDHPTWVSVVGYREEDIGGLYRSTWSGFCADALLAEFSA